MLRIGIIGCGRVSSKHINAINNSKYELISICDINESRLSKYKSLKKVKTYSNYNSMILAEKLDVISILTDSGSHEKIINDISGKVKNIIVEKPFTLTTSGAKRIINKCNKDLSRVFVVHQNRLNKTVQKLFELKSQNKLGKIFLISVNLYWSRSEEYYKSDLWRGKWKTDGGVIANQGIHYIDIIQQLLGDPNTIFAEGNTAMNHIETEDTASINFKYKDGCIVNFQLTTGIRPKNMEGSISIFSDKGSLQIGGLALNEIKDINIIDLKLEGSLNTEIKDLYGQGHQIFYNELYDKITQNLNSQFEGKNLVNLIRLINAIYTSIERSSKIYFDSNKNYKTKLGIYESSI